MSTVLAPPVKKHKCGHYWLGVGKDNYEVARWDFTSGGCAVLAWALWQRLPTWKPIILTEFGSHVILGHPKSDWTLDICGLQKFYDKASKHYYGEVDENSHLIYTLDLNTSDGIRAFFHLTRYYKVSVRDQEDMEYLIGNDFKRVNYWADKIVERSKKIMPKIIV